LHSLSRAGALIAGADDADALWLDPAGLAHLAGDGKKSFLFDVAYVYEPVDYAGVSNQQPGSAVPTIAGALGIGESLVIAGGISAPYSGFGKYDPTGPQRYAGVSVAGSSFVQVTVGAGYVVTPRLRVGATLQDLVTSLDLEVVTWDCPATCTASDPAYDARVRVQETSYLAPSGSLGAQYDASDTVTFGATFQGPLRVGGSGTFTTTIPTSPTFAGMTVSGSSGSASFWLPPSLRASLLFHATPAIDVEAALDAEFWSLHDRIDITPDNVRIGTQPLAAMQIVRDYRTSYAPSLGAEAHVGAAAIAAGVAYETAAAPTSSVSILTVDAPKLVLGAGGGYREGGWQIGAAVGYTRLSDVTVSDPRVLQLQPLHTPTPDPINAGTYHAYYILAGLRAARTF
jgi:long-subunit fatty acid transport protein